MMRTPMPLNLVLGLVFVACTGAPAPPPDTSEADAAAIREQNPQWLAAYNAGDAAAIGMFYTEDAISLRPDGPPVVGREAIVQQLTDFFEKFSASQTSTVDEVSVSGDLAFARGSWNTHQTPKAGGDEQVRTGKWLELYKRQADGSWLAWRWMWNEEPAEGMAGT